MTRNYRQGPVGALADEYERNLEELKAVVRAIPPGEFRASTAREGEQDFLTHGGIVQHVVLSGYAYANYIRRRFNQETEVCASKVASPAEALVALDAMFAYTLQTFEGKWNLTDEQMLNTLIKTSWSFYDLEGLIEHAIVHVARHRRQIERLAG